MANWQKDLGMASTGAGIGSAVLPGIGTAIGGGLGLLAGLFSSDDDKPQIPDDPNRGQEDALIQKLSSNKISDTAANAQNKAKRSFMETMENYKNIPGVGHNASVISKLGVKANDSLGESLVDIDTADAKSRLSNQIEAGNMIASQKNFDFQRNSANINLQRKPSVLESIGQFAATNITGGIVGAFNQKAGRDLAGSVNQDGGGDGTTGGDGPGGFYDRLINPNPQMNPYDYRPTPMSLFN